MKLLSVFRLIFYITLIFIFYYAKTGLKGRVDVLDRQMEKSVQKPKEAKVTLEVSDGNLYSVTLTNSESVSDFLDYLRENNNFTYEKTAYIYGSEFNSINGIKAEDGYKWNLYLDGSNVTFKTGDINISNGQVYLLKLVKE